MVLFEWPCQNWFALYKGKPNALCYHDFAYMGEFYIASRAWFCIFLKSAASLLHVGIYPFNKTDMCILYAEAFYVFKDSRKSTPCSSSQPFYPIQPVKCAGSFLRAMFSSDTVDLCFFTPSADDFSGNPKLLGAQANNWF